MNLLNWDVEKLLPKKATFPDLFWVPPPNQTKPSGFEFFFVNIGNVPVKEKGPASWIPN